MSTSPDEPLSTTAARDSFAEVINRAAYGKERVVLTRRGKPLVAVVPIEDMELLEGLEDELDSALIRQRIAERGAAGRPGKPLEDSARPRLELSSRSRSPTAKATRCAGRQGCRAHRGALRRVATNPYAAPNVKTLKGGGFRLRVGDWRVLYEVRDDLLVVLVARVAHRREVYRGRPKGG